MRLQLKNIVIAAVTLTVFSGLSPAQTQSSASHSKSVHKTKHRPRKGAWKRHGQQKIEAARATEIQQALIREKYLDGQATGNWDARTEAAMSRYQADHGWQSKVTPDSRALIKLGLGPNHQGELINRDAKPDTDAGASATSSTSNAQTTGASKP